MRSTLRKGLQLLGGEPKMKWLLLVVLALLVTGVEAVGAALVFLLLQLVTDGAREVDLPGLGSLGEVAPAMSATDLSLWAAAGVGFFFILRAAMLVAQAYAQGRITENIGARLSTRLVDGYMAMPHQYHLRRNSSEMVRNAFDTVRIVVVEVYVPLVTVLSEALVVLGLIVVLVVAAPAATALAVGVIGPALYLLLRLVHPRLRALGALGQSSSAECLQLLQQSLDGSRDIKVLGRERYFRKRYAAARARLARARYMQKTIKELPRVTTETALVLFIAGLFVVLILWEGSAVGAVPVLGLFAYAVQRLKPSLNKIVAGVNSLRFASAAVDDLYDDLTGIEQARSRLDRVGNPDDLPFEQDIVFDGVSFRYEGTDADVLCGVHLRIAKGESIGIVGPTGGGKSTLVDLLLGLLEPTEGEIRVDGRSLLGAERGWQRQLGVVPQSTFLTDDTLRRNICLGLNDEEIDAERLAIAVDQSQLGAFVRSLPEGLDTVVGERGLRVSGGQRQRIAIARALYQDPRVLVMDEGTSALDNNTESELMKALERLRADRTIIMVAHRLSTVRRCDQVLLIDEGKFVDVGTYDDLVGRHAALLRARG